MLGRLVLHLSHYTTGSLLVTLASVISFPIFTRTFSAAEYGALNLITSYLMLWIGLGKLGVQQSITRFHAEVIAGRRGITESQYLSTIFIGMGCVGGAATLGAMLANYVIPPAWWNNEHVAKLIVPVSLLVIARVMDSAINNTLRAQQRSILYNVYGVARKYVGLGLILIIMFHFIPGLAGFYVGTILAETLAAAVLIGYLAWGYRMSWRGFSPETFRAMLAFGLPMIALEFSGITLNLGSRYVIQLRLGPEALGHFSAAYNFCEYLQIVLFASFATAVTPIYVRMWEQQGPDATRYFIRRAVRFYFMLAAAVLAGMAAVGPTVLTTLASDKYAEGGVVIPFVVAGLFIDGGSPLFGAGMYIFKQNRKIIPFVATAALLNIGLNWVLTPKIGLLGSGIATLACYIFVASNAWRIGQQNFKISFPIRDVCKFGILAAIMYVAVQQVSAANRYQELGLKIATGVVVYALLVLAFDQPTRETMGKIGKGVLARLRGGARG